MLAKLASIKSEFSLSSVVVSSENRRKKIMKIISKLSLLLLAVAPLCASVEGTLIKKNIVIEEGIAATLMRTTFLIEKEAKEPSGILKSFSASNKSILDLTEKEDIRCKGGQNRIFPNYIYHSDKKQNVFTGYKGAVSYDCTFDKIESYNALLNASFEDGQRLNLSPIQWIITEEKKKEVLKMSEKKLAKEALSAVNDYALILNKKCTLHTLEIASDSPRPLHMASYAKSVSASAMLENFQPTQDNVVVQLTGMVEIQCE